MTITQMDTLARAVHEAWRKRLRLEGRTHELDKPFEQLSAAQREYDRSVAEAVIDALADVLTGPD